MLVCVTVINETYFAHHSSPLLRPLLHVWQRFSQRLAVLHQQRLLAA